MKLLALLYVSTPNIRTCGRTKRIKFITENSYYFHLDNNDDSDDDK
jgi:hypothetical protein